MSKSTLSAKTLILAIICGWGPSLVVSGSESGGTLSTQANVMVEITFTATRDYHDPFHDIALDAVFQTPQGRTLKVPGFWAGGRAWKVRYASPEVGTHRWRIACSVTTDRGLHDRTGTVVVTPYQGENLLYRHGPVRVAADRRHFEYLDGTPFFWLGDTWWMGLCHRLHWPEEFQRLAADRKAKGFNLIQIVAGLYPDMPAFDPRGANEAGFPWQKDYSSIRPEYFNQADKRLKYLVDQGFVPCIVGAWGYHLPWMGTDRIKEHWRYVIARYGALPVVWCAAGEGTMPFYGSKHASEDAALQKQGWSEVIRSIRATDPFGRMITIHPSRSARETVTDPSLLDFDMHQTGHGPEDTIGQMAAQMRGSYEVRPAMPVIAGESSYDGLDFHDWGGAVLSSAASRQMFWIGLMHNGAAGGTYGANGVWQLNRRDMPYGPSPHGRSWGSVPWDEAMLRPSSAQVGYAKQFFTRYPWHRLEPKPDTVAWGDNQPIKENIRPCALGTGTDLRIVYVPRPRPVVVKQLVPQADYMAGLFDPVTGVYSSLGQIKTNEDGSWQRLTPDHGHDWVLVLQRPTNQAAASPIGGVSPIAEPYPYVSSGSFSGPAVAASPDPLVRYRWPNPKASDGLEIYLRQPESTTCNPPSSFANVKSLLTLTPSVTVSGTGTIRVDFGRENAGWFEIDSPDCPGGIQLSISEYNEPAYIHTGDKTIVPEKIGNTYRAKFNKEYYEGVRFGFVHVNSLAHPWHITGIRLVCQVKPANYEGRFECSDPMLNKIWYVSAYSVKLANLKDFTTPILMERTDRYLWNGMDFYLYNTANMVALKNYDFVKQQITKVNTPPGINCGIPSYELYDVLSICDFYNYTSDAGFVSACNAMACAKLDRAKDRYQAGGRGFMGWDERLGGFERVTSYNEWNYRMLCIRSWRKFAKVMGRMGNTAARDKYNGFADAKIAALRRNKTWYASLDVHGCAEAIQAGFCTRAEIKAMCAAEFADRVNRVSYSQANTGMILQGMARAGKYDDAICTLKDQWGATIEYGGTTTFEMFHPSAADALGKNDPPINGQCGQTSLCHPWGALPCKYLNEEVLGIKPTTPGFGTVDIFPHLGRKLTRVAGTTPTLKGDISASFDITSGKCRVTVPSGVTARVGIPKVERTIKSITLNGALAWDGKYHPLASIGGASENAEFVCFTSVQPGSYDFRVSYEGTTPAAVDPPEVFPVKFVGEDAATQGNWGGKYGTDGYVLPNYNGVGKDVRRLPSYVTSLVFDAERCANVTWATSTTDVRAPARDRTNSGTRSASAIYTKDPEPTFQTMFFDITVSGTHDYTLALYFLDWDFATRRVGVQMIDPQTLKQLAPVKVVRDYHAGKYLIYKYNRSVRVRIDTIKKPNATLSGIFFSP